ncbi:substrate-binding domain-containing protein [Stenotrophomonas geniculata]|jgi:ABC-type phosphate transport system substrate-binding protein|uniref:substrate-binding domain-containing protein n=1 Tax=Stenotrophomonas TaxID=40323 RepID=UPI002097AAA0|nr:substrate-binding domain-containing protein [Stenotrophomonas maltophilia]MCO7460523.1 substrate-binding domain-containing protein [Stenotrophomonas maltophilia]
MKRKLLAVLYIGAALCGTASAQVKVLPIKGAGSAVPAKLYAESADRILPSNVTYRAVGDELARRAFLENVPETPGEARPPHFIATESVLTGAEILAYNTNHAKQFGALIQVPVAGLAIALPFNKPGGTLDLSVPQLCRLFSGKTEYWGDLDPDRSGVVRVIYRAEKSGTTELLTRFLSTACSSLDTAGSNLVGGSFKTTRDFASLFSALPTNFVAATSEQAQYDRVMATGGAIGYSGPDIAVPLSDPTRVAKVRGYSPDDASVRATLDSIAPPTGSAAERPDNWVPTFSSPPVGYPIVGTTNLIFSQCYAELWEAMSLRVFLIPHYARRNDAAVSAHRFVPLAPAWAEAIRSRFAVAGVPTGLNNPSTCAGIGRP